MSSTQNLSLAPCFKHLFCFKSCVRCFFCLFHCFLRGAWRFYFYKPRVISFTDQENPRTVGLFTSSPSFSHKPPTNSRSHHSPSFVVLSFILTKRSPTNALIPIPHDHSLTQSQSTPTATAIGHFRITSGLFFEASLGAHLFICKINFHSHENEFNLRVNEN